MKDSEFIIRVGSAEYRFGGYSHRNALERFMTLNYEAQRFGPTRVGQEVRFSVLDTDEYKTENFVLSLRKESE